EFDGLSPQEGLQRLEDLKNHPSVLHAAPNTLLITPKQVVPGPQFDPQEISFFAPSPLVPVSWPNDAYYKFGHQKPEFAQINAPDAWEYTIGGCNVKIAIVDDGIDVNHNDLKDKILASYDAYYDDNDPQPSKDDAHGMASAGVAAAITNNSTGVAGTIWGGKIIPIRIFDSDGSYVTTPYILQNGLLAAVELDADVLSNSWGFSPGVGAGQDFIIVNNAIDTAIAAGKVLVFSVGNGTTNVEWPASLSTNKDLIAVGAIGTDDKILTTSKWMPVGTVTLAAPGASINTTDISGPDGWNTDQGTAGDYYHTFADTSAAAPFVAGAAALLLSWAPGTQPATIRDWLALGVTAPSDPLESHKYGAGILNIAHSIELAGTSNTLLTITAAPMVRLWSGRETFIRVNVQRNGQPLSGVRVTFESENTLLAQIVSDDETVPTDCDGVAQVRVRGVSGSMTQDTTDIKAKLANLEQSVTITVGGLSMIEMLALLLGLLLSLATWKFFKRRRGA
ncbi:MAG: S8 family serine peptidase, partial [Gammaproteobacteria bacterium]|nr:S8 family serine peptidase [Gammaproteobacteria bacterium]